VSGLDLALAQGERVGIIGKNGTGKTTLRRALLGELEPAKGEIVRGANTKIAYFDQQRGGLDDDKSIFDNVGGDKARIPLGGRVLEVRSYLERFLFDPHKQRQPVGSLSGGERNRVQLARLLRRGGNLLVLDEPTNDLDLPTLGALEEGLLAFPGCALIVSHDRWFLDRVATAILAFEGDGKVTLYEGSYSFYAERRPKPKAAEGKPRESKDTRAPKPTGPRKLTFKEKHELASIEATIAAAEARVLELEATLQDPAVFKDRGAEVTGLVAQLDAGRAEIERLFARWQELDAIAAASPPS
jgi:ATP-binding cassette subfamily F protein uup